MSIPVRTTQYDLSMAAGADTVDLSLAQPLEANYFVLHNGSTLTVDAVDGSQARTDADPFGGYGEPAVGASLLRFSRQKFDVAWAGQATVVECTGTGPDAFTLVSAEMVALPGTNGLVQTTTIPYPAGVTSVGQLTAIAGIRGAGISVDPTAGASDGQTPVGIAIEMDDVAQEMIVTRAGAGGFGIQRAAELSIQWIEWGSNYTVTKDFVGPTTTQDHTFTTPGLLSAQTMVFGTVCAANTIANSALETRFGMWDLTTLPGTAVDGEVRYRRRSALSINHWFGLQAISHPDLKVDYAQVQDALVDSPFTAPVPTSTETYGPPVEGRRACLVSAAGAPGTSHQRTIDAFRGAIITGNSTGESSQFSTVAPSADNLQTIQILEFTAEAPSESRARVGIITDAVGVFGFVAQSAAAVGVQTSASPELSLAGEARATVGVRATAAPSLSLGAESRARVGIASSATPLFSLTGESQAVVGIATVATPLLAFAGESRAFVGIEASADPSLTLGAESRAAVGIAPAATPALMFEGESQAIVGVSPGATPQLALTGESRALVGVASTAVPELALGADSRASVGIALQAVPSLSWVGESRAFGGVLTTGGTLLELSAEVRAKVGVATAAQPSVSWEAQSNANVGVGTQALADLGLSGESRAVVGAAPAALPSLQWDAESRTFVGIAVGAVPESVQGLQGASNATVGIAPAATPALSWVGQSQAVVGVSPQANASVDLFAESQADVGIQTAAQPVLGDASLAESRAFVGAEASTPTPLLDWQSASSASVGARSGALPSITWEAEARATIGLSTSGELEPLASITWLQVLDFAPALEGCPLTMQQLILQYVDCKLPDCLFKCPPEATLARIYLAAHLGSDAKGGASGAKGPVTSKKRGPISATWSAPNLQASSSAWGSTSYGRQLLDILRNSKARMPFLIP